MKIVDLADWNKFIDSMYASWHHRNPVTYKNIEYFIADSNTTCIINVKTGKVAVAKCHPKDRYKWSSKVGLAVAWAKYLGKEIPKCGTRYWVEIITGLDFGTKLYVREKLDCGKFVDHEMMYAGHGMDAIYLYDPDSEYTSEIPYDMIDTDNKYPDIAIYLPY